MLHARLAFGLLTCAAAQSLAQDRYTNYYSGSFEQVGPTDLIESRYAFVSVNAQAQSGNFSSAAVKPPPAPAFIPMTSSSSTFFISDLAPTFNDLVLQFPGGDYLFNITGGSLGDRIVTVTSPDMETFQGTNPTFSAATWNARTSFDASQPITIDWSPLDVYPGDLNDNVQFTIVPVPSAFQPAILTQSLSPSTTSFTIAPGTLAPTHDYLVQITRIRSASVPVANDPGAIGLVQISKSTELLIRTGADQCNGDINHDSVVDDADFSLFIVPYDILECSAPVMTFGCQADLNGDGAVNDADFSLFIVNYDNLLCP